MDDKDARPADESAGADEAVDVSALWSEFDAQDAAADKAAPSATIEDKEQSQATDQEAKDNDTEAAAAEDKDKAAGGETKAPDIWATATPEQKAAYDAAQARAAALEHADASNRGRVSALTKQIDSLKKPAAKPAKNEVAELMEGKDFKTAQAEYPEIMAPVKAVLDKVSAVITPLTETVEQTKTTVSAITQERTKDELLKQEAVVLEKHPEYPQIAKSDAFMKWYREAPTYLKEGVERNAKVVVDGNEVADIVSRFKTDTGWKPTKPAADSGGDPKPDPSKKRELQRESAKTPNSRGTAAVISGIPDDEEGAWKAYERMGL